MKTPLGLVFAFLVAAVPIQAGAAEVEEPVPAELSEDHLDKLLGPLALHPDPLVALILPASTTPTDIVLAARFLRSGGKVTAENELGWDDSVLALARYPEIVYWLDEELSWTVDVGEAFMAEPAAVMNAIQRLRARASAAGSLSTTHQQRVVVEDNIISIVPASTRVIYIPRYDPIVVYTPRPDHRPAVHLHFGFGRPVGAWLRYDCDWWSRRIWCFDRSRRDRHDWDRWRHHYRERIQEIPGAHPWRPRHDARDHDWRARRSREVVHIPRPRFDAEPPTRARILDDNRGARRAEGPRPGAIRRLDSGRVERDLSPRENPRRSVERREPRPERDIRARPPVVRSVERETRPRLAPPPRIERPAPRVERSTPRIERSAPRIERPAPNPQRRHSARVDAAPRPAAPRVSPPPSAPAHVPAPSVAPAPRSSAPALPAPSDRGRSSREKTER